MAARKFKKYKKNKFVCVCKEPFSKVKANLTSFSKGNFDKF